MPFPDLSAAPFAVQIAFYALAAIGIVLGGVLVRLGWINGRNTPPATTKSEVAAVVVDPSALHKLSRTIEGNSAALAKLADEVGKFREEMRVSREVMASKR